MGPRGRAPEAHPHARLRRPDLRFPHHGRTRQRPFERRVRRQICPRPRRTQGQMPSHVRHRRACRRSDHPRRRLKDRPGLTHPGSPPPPGAGKFTSLRVFCKKLAVQSNLTKPTTLACSRPIWRYLIKMEPGNGWFTVSQRQSRPEYAGDRDGRRMMRKTLTTMIASLATAMLLSASAANATVYKFTFESFDTQLTATGEITVN